MVTALASPRASAHDPRLELPDPLTVEEAWDVIRQCTDNIGKLLVTNQLKDIAFQVAVCSPQFRLLEAKAAVTDPRPEELKANLTELFDTGTALILATREKAEPRRSRSAQYQLWRTRARRHRRPLCGGNRLGARLRLSDAPGRPAPEAATPGARSAR